jgi:G3E family GTPase
VHGAAALARHPECRKQVAVADRLIVTKTDLAAADDIASLFAMLVRLNPAAETLDVQALDGLEPLLAPSRLSGSQAPAAFAQHLGSAPGAHEPQPHAEHSNDVSALALTLSQPLDWSPFSVWLSLLLHAHGENILRFKALLDIAGWNAPVALDGVHHLIHPPVHLPAWPAGPRRSHIVIIGQGMPMRRVEPSLREFLASHVGKARPMVASTAFSATAAAG